MNRILPCLLLAGLSGGVLRAQPDPATVYAWFKADAGVQTNASGTVTTWINQAAAGTPSTRNLNSYGKPPIWVANAFGTNPAVRFAGTNNIWAASANFGTITTNRTIVACLQLPGSIGGFLFDGSTGAGMSRAQVRDGFWQAGLQPSPAANGANADPGTLPILTATRQVHYFGFERVGGGTRVTHSIFNGSSFTYTNTVTTGLGGLILGQNVSQSLGLPVDVAEFFVYDRSLTTNEQQALGDYLSSKWRLVALSSPALTSIAPTSGSTLGGTLVALTGSNFAAGLTVKFGGLAALAVNFSNATLVTAATPAMLPGTVDVQVTSPDGQFGVLSNAFTAVTPPVVPPSATNAYAWYAGDTSLAVGADNYSVTTWSNLGTAATNATYTQTKRNLTRLIGTPQKLWLRLTNGLAAAAVSFDGTDGLWAAQSDFGAITSDRTVMAFLRVANATPQGFLFDSSSYTIGLTRAQVNGGNWQVSVYGAGATAYAVAPGIVTAPAETNVWQVHSFVVKTNSEAMNFRHYINGTQVGLVTNSAAGALGGVILGMNASAAVGIRADVAELLVFNSALEDVQRSSVERYLAAKWARVVADTNAPTPPVNEFVRVFSAGVDGYTCFRIPAIVTTANGTLIALSDGRIGSCGDIPTPLDLVCKRSFDNGKTWGPLQVIANYGSDPSDVDTYPFYGATNISRVSAGDSALLLDRTNGRVWTLYDNGGTTGSRKIKLELRYSDDDGATWSPAVDVEAQNPGVRPGYGEFVAGPGNGIQMMKGPRAGRLIFPVYIISSPESSMCIYSDNHGATWQRGAAITGGGEMQVAETPDGGLIASMRDGGFSWSGVRTFSRSTDAGETWGAAYIDTVNPPTIPDPACQGNIYRLTTTNDSNASRLIHVNAANSSSRVNMTLRISYDEGATWAMSNQVYAGGSAYSSVTKLATAEVGLLFEKDPYGSLDYIRRSVSQITGGADSLPPYAVWAGEHFTPAQLMNSSISGPEADPDGDEFNNYAEFIAGTDPLNAGNRLKLNLSPTPTNAMLQFDGVSNKSYTVQFRDDLAAGFWQRLADITPLPSNSAITVPVGTTNAARFFRLTTPQIPGLTP